MMNVYKLLALGRGWREEEVGAGAGGNTSRPLSNNIYLKC